MTAPRAHLLTILLSLLLVIPSSYVLGRVHQWYNQCLRRDAAFRNGYDHGAHAMVGRAVSLRHAAAGDSSRRPVAAASVDIAR